MRLVVFRLILKDDNQWVGWHSAGSKFLFVINIGDTLEAWTNGRLKSVVHRAVANKEKRRLSSAYFMSPACAVMIDCPPQLLVDEDGANPSSRKYAPFTWGDFRKQLLIQKMVLGKTAFNRFLIKQP